MVIQYRRRGSLTRRTENRRGTEDPTIARRVGGQSRAGRRLGRGSSTKRTHSGDGQPDSGVGIPRLAVAGLRARNLPRLAGKGLDAQEVGAKCSLRDGGELRRGRAAVWFEQGGAREILEPGAGALDDGLVKAGLESFLFGFEGLLLLFELRLGF